MINPNNKNKSALVTGGSRGIGRAISLRLARTVAETIFVNYVQNDEEAKKTQKLIERAGSKCILEKANLLYPKEIDQLFENISSNEDKLDILIHCAAINAFKPLKDIKPNQWDLTMNINARSLLLCSRNAAQLMKRGHVVAISSLGSQKVIPNYGAMGPTKAALESIIKYLSVELAPQDIRVNGVSGGLIETESLRNFPNSQKLKIEVVSKTPAKRLGTPEDIADVVMFLISPAAEFIYGQTIVADGGLSLL